MKSCYNFFDAVRPWKYFGDTRDPFRRKKLTGKGLSPRWQDVFYH